jgi:hypothetical protein
MKKRYSVMIQITELKFFLFYQLDSPFLLKNLFTYDRFLIKNHINLFRNKEILNKSDCEI